MIKKMGLPVLLVVASGFQTICSGTVIYSTNFSSPSETGSVGGGLLNPSATQQIGSGPWTGTYNGILGVLAPPRLTISNTGGYPSGGSATISEIAGINALGLGLVNSTGWFQTNIGTGYAPNTSYVLSANVSTGTLLTANLLTSHNVGIALLDGSGSIVASSTDGAHFLSLQLLSGDCYQLQVLFTTGGSVPSGNIGIRLFDAPSGLLTANLFNTVKFSNVSLDAVPEPISLSTVGAGLLGVAVLARRRRRR